MAGTRSGGRGKTPTKATSKSGNRRNNNLKKQKQARSDTESDNEPSVSDILAELERVKKENSILKSGGSGKKRSSHAADNISSAYKEEVVNYVSNEIWRKTKFVANVEENRQICERVMKGMPEFQHLVTDDPAETKENVEAFEEVYGRAISKALNSKRTNCQGNIRKAYIKRAMAEAPGYMPTPQELLMVVRRKGMDLLEVPKLKKIPEAPDMRLEDHEVLQAAWEAEKAEIEQENIAIQAEIDRITALNANPEKLRDVLLWYWMELLPAVVGKHNWGKNIRAWNTITDSHFPGEPNKKYITTSDEALVVTLYENCGQRFPYTVKCLKTGEKVDTQHAEYQSKWSNDSSGQCQYGGFHPDGRTRYHNLFKNIAKNKKKDHVLPLEKEILAKIKDTKDEEDETEDEENSDKSSKAAKIVKVALLDSDDEIDGESDIDDFEAVFQKPRQAKPKRAKKN